MPFPAGKNARSVAPLLAASIAIGVADNSAFFCFQIGTGDLGYHVMVAALLLWIALFGIGIHSLRIRSLWLLLGLPLVLFPFALAIIGAAQI
jgi:hypothetical protein